MYDSVAEDIALRWATLSAEAATQRQGRDACAHELEIEQVNARPVVPKGTRPSVPEALEVERTLHFLL